MTEREWLSDYEPWLLVSYARTIVPARKLRLFACACARLVLNEFAPGIAERSLVAAELFADGELKADTLEYVRHTLTAARRTATRDDIRTRSGYTSFLLGACLSACHPGDAYELAQEAIQSAARAAADVPWTNADRDAELAEYIAEARTQSHLFRCIVGNPFAPVAFDPAWRTSDAVALAQSMYESRDFSAMPILADALQEAGCDNEQVLTHCRDAGEHARGCWVCDSVLSK